MPITLKEFTREREKEWDSFVEGTNNGTLFHLRKFLNYHSSGKFNDSSVFVEKANKVIAVIPSATLQNENERVYYSHPGASYGGIAMIESVDLQDTSEIVNLTREHARELTCDKIIMTIPPSHYYQNYNSYLDFALLRSGFSYKIRELSSVLNLDGGVESVYANFAPSVNRAIRKAEKCGLHVSESHNIQNYYSILKSNLSMRHNVNPTHSLDELKRLFELFPERISLYAAESAGEMVGGIITFGCNARVNLAFYIAHKHEFQNSRPVDLVIWHVIQESIRKGYSYLDFGTFTLKEKPNWGLCRFKEKFGARGIFRDTLECSIAHS